MPGTYQSLFLIVIINCMNLKGDGDFKVNALGLIGSFFFFFLVVNFVIHWNETAMGLHVFFLCCLPK